MRDTLWDHLPSAIYNLPFTSCLVLVSSLNQTMLMNNSNLLHRSIAVLFFFFLVIAGLYFTKSFLVPVVLAAILAMLFLPLTKKLEAKGVNRVVAIILCILILLTLVAGVVWLVSWQIGNFAEDTAKLQQQLSKLGDRIREFADKSLGIKRSTQEQLIKQQQQGGGGTAGKMGMAVLSFISNIMVNFILVMVYFFLFIYLREHIKKFILKVTPDNKRKTTEVVIHDASKVGQQYLGGLALMIFLLWIMYGIGFSIAGVKYAIFFAILCGLLEIIPFVGNITGTTLTAVMAVSQGAGTGVLIGVVITYAIVQFIQTYLIEPMVVGSQVNINPLFTIVAIVAGEMIWGIPGMILAIPLTGILKIICDHIEPLKPYGFLIGVEPKERNKPGWIDKIKEKFSGEKK